MDINELCEWRGINPKHACTTCNGSGYLTYGDTSTWRGDFGGQMLTSDICNKCWGSGNKYNPWLNLKQNSEELEEVKRELNYECDQLRGRLDRAEKKLAELGVK